MPIWAEVLSLSLAAYGTGLAIAWLMFGRDTSTKE